MLKLFIFSFFFVFSFMPSPVWAKDFVAGFEDIPLMDGLKQIDNADIAFGNEETRFIEAQMEASEGIDFPSIQKFYQETLPQLGWKEAESQPDFSKFYRENDILEIGKIANYPLKISISLKNRN